MTFITSLALRRPTVAILAIVLVLISGVLAYRSMQVELFPQIEFPLVTVFATYPSADPEAVVRDVTGPIEQAIMGDDGLESVRSNSSEGRASIFATYRYGTDMAEAEVHVQNSLNGLDLPPGVEPPTVGRFNPDEIPVIEFGVVSDRPLLQVQGFVEDFIVPEIEKVDGVSGSGTARRRGAKRNGRCRPGKDGGQRRLPVPESPPPCGRTIVTLPAGLLFDGNQAVIAKTTHSLGFRGSPA